MKNIIISSIVAVVLLSFAGFNLLKSKKNKKVEVAGRDHNGYPPELVH